MPLEITETKEPMNKRQITVMLITQETSPKLLTGGTQNTPVQCILDRTNTEYNKLTILVGESLS